MHLKSFVFNLFFKKFEIYFEIHLLSCTTLDEIEEPEELKSTQIN